MTYKLADGGIKRSDGAFIPADESNSDYQEYLKWLNQGGVPAPADPPQVVMRYVTKNTAYNRIETLYGLVKLEQVCDLLNNLPRVQKRRYDDAQDIDCSNQDVILALQSLGIDPTQILY